jgi:hypothetical protein
LIRQREKAKIDKKEISKNGNREKNMIHKG